MWTGPKQHQIKNSGAYALQSCQLHTRYRIWNRTLLSDFMCLLNWRAFVWYFRGEYVSRIGQNFVRDRLLLWRFICQFLGNVWVDELLRSLKNWYHLKGVGFYQKYMKHIIYIHFHIFLLVILYYTLRYNIRYCCSVIAWDISLFYSSLSPFLHSLGAIFLFIFRLNKNIMGKPTQILFLHIPYNASKFISPWPYKQHRSTSLWLILFK